MKRGHVGDRIKQLLGERDKTPEQLAAYCKVSVQAVYTTWIRNGKVSRRKLEMIAAFFEISIDELLHGAQAASPAKFQYVIRVRGAVLSAGRGEPVFEHQEIDNSHAFRSEWLLKNGLRPERLRLFEVNGTSMSPTFEAGDVVLINLDATQIVSGKAYALVVGGELLIKRLRTRADGALEVRSDNTSPQYPTDVIQKGDERQVQILGRVIWRGGEL